MTQKGMVLVTCYFTAEKWAWEVTPVLFCTIEKARQFTSDVKRLAEMANWRVVFTYYHFLDQESTHEVE